MKLRLNAYVEEKPQRHKRLFWLALNKTLFRILPRYKRIALLRLFGARIGKGCWFRPSLNIFAPWNLTVGDYVGIGPNVNLYNKAPMIIGSQVSISQDAYICTATHNITSPRMELITKPIRIESQAWVAAKATILPGVTIGEGAVVGACAVVAKDVPPWSVVVGNPARVVGKRDIGGE